MTDFEKYWQPTCETPQNCRLRESGGMTTCAYYPPIYDSTGRNTNPDMNTTTSTLTCLSCGKVFDVQSCNGERTVKQRDVPTEKAE